MNRFDYVLLLVLHFDNTFRLENAGTRFWVGVSFHIPRVDGWIKHSPCTSAQLGIRWKVHDHGLCVFPQTIHDVSTEFDNLFVHI